MGGLGDVGVSGLIGFLLLDFVVMMNMFFFLGVLDYNLYGKGWSTAVA